MLKKILVCGGLLVLFAGTALGEGDTFAMPGNMQKLLPAEPALIVAVSSVNELDRHWQAIEEMMDDGSGERTDIVGLLSEQIPQFADFAALDRPLLVAMGLPDMMAGEEQPLTFILPLKEQSREDIAMVIDQEGVIYLREGDYLALSLDPGYAPAVEIPELARTLSPGFLTASLDLEMVVAAYRPLAEMGLTALADTTAIGTRPAGALVTQKNAAEVLDLIRAVMDSARRFDLAIRIEGENLTLHSGFAAADGSALDPGPQPSFENALMLTRLLPDGGNFLQVMAMDQTRQFEVFRSFYLASLEMEIADMPAEQGDAYRRWVESYIESIDLFSNPVAASINMSTEGMAANIVMECDDAAADLQRLAAIFEGLSAAGIGMRMNRMPTGKVAGTEVHSWTIDYEVEKMVALPPDAKNPQMAGAGRMQAEQMIAMLRKVTPNVHLAARGDYLILSADSDLSHLTHMIHQADQRRGAAHPEVAAVAARVGPACQQVITGDMMAILAWVTEWMEELGEEELAAIEGNPIPFTAAATIEGAAYGMDWTMDMPAMANFIQAMEELEALDDQRKEEVPEESPVPGNGDPD